MSDISIINDLSCLTGERLPAGTVCRRVSMSEIKRSGL